MILKRKTPVSSLPLWSKLILEDSLGGIVVEILVQILQISRANASTRSRLMDGIDILHEHTTAAAIDVFYVGDEPNPCALIETQKLMRNNLPGLDSRIEYSDMKVPLDGVPS